MHNFKLSFKKLSYKILIENFIDDRTQIQLIIALEQSLKQIL